MLTKSKRWLIVCMFFTLFLVGCNCDDAETDAFITIQDFPAEGSLLSSLLPTFEWHHNESCEPDTFFVKVKKAAGPDPDYESAAGNASSFAWPDSLDPGSKYYWYVQARADNGPRGLEAGPITFFTGPVCSGEALIAPDLEDPHAAAWLDGHPIFKWTYNGGCLPTSYEVQFSRDAAFTDIYKTTSTSDPYVQHLNLAFPDCSTLFWRVRASDGTTTGPWSDSRDFHYIISGGCYQWHYLSDDFAWIYVHLLEDRCDQTGEMTAWTAAPLNPGCMPDGMIIVGDGTLYNGFMDDFVVDLGAGPCPSTGLDQKTASSSQAKFGVITPGTYCVTISRNQTVDNNGSVNLMDGIWTSPRVHNILAEQTIDLGPGNSDNLIRFFWDEIDRPFLTLPLNYTYKCKLGPEDNCPTYDFAMKGEVLPIFARDADTDYKLAELNGMPCYVLLSDGYLDERLAEMGGSMMAADLRYFVPPEPCAPPDSKPNPSNGFSCSIYGDYDSCNADSKCFWDRKQTPDACVSR